MIIMERLAAYELLSKEEIPELDSVGYLLRHKKTGARVALLENADENKVFNIGFRTPPCGQHGSCLIFWSIPFCDGSRDFPVKDPFVELVKGSLEYLPECHDLSGQDHVSGGKLQ